ncbi:site-specific integrase [Actinomadura spongiicola]|uniref:Site-specific integrase n=1 Tax=Actinomadura spongiicola TaxID=2303421 RepID=A0A372GFK2_9ACTN|nr:tyrosine-type recombinase/integrase [Actinomadura spongiicola]RFS84137.1 site-specific integrase [Actinomadura spongiicola]
MAKTALATPDDPDEPGRAPKSSRRTNPKDTELGKEARARKRSRANGEGSIFPYRNGWACYVWVTTPAGDRRRKWRYGQSRDAVHDKYVKLLAEAADGPITTTIPTLDQHVAYWLAEAVIEPDYAPLTISTYETHTRLHIRPYLGSKRLDRLTIRDVRSWINKLRTTCQCCKQGKDAARRPAKRRCCALEKRKCCKQVLSERSVQDVLGCLRSVLSNAVTEEIISKNVATKLKLPRPRRTRVKPWSVKDASRFLEATREAGEALYAAFVLTLILGLRKGEVLGLTWEQVDLDAGELWVGEQLQRVRRQLLRRQVKTEASENGLPIPAICIAALRQRKEEQDADREQFADRWTETGLVFTTRYGTPIEPRNFNRSFDRWIEHLSLPRITVHGTRKTCATLLAALDVHPRIAMRILRHSKIAVTMEIYTEATDDDTREALRKLGSCLDGRPADGTR